VPLWNDIYIILLLLAAMLFWVHTGSFGDKAVFQHRVNSTQSTIESVSNDIEWGVNVQKHLTILKADYNNVSTDVNNSNYTALTVSAQSTITYTQKAIDENDRYKVSLKLQDAQKEWKTALHDYNSAGTFLLKRANEAKRNAGGLEYLKKATTSFNSGIDHLKSVSSPLGINLSLKST
jgi:hypothetical protein